MNGRRGWRWVVALVAVAALLAAVTLTLPLTLTPGLRTRLTVALGERFDSQVELNALHVSVLPRLRVVGEGVVFRHKGRTDVPPLITVASFTAEANLFRLFGRSLRLRRVHLRGLEINVAPGGIAVDPQSHSKGPQPQTSPIVVDDLLSESAVVRILRSRSDKPARVFDIHHLSMQGIGSNVPWAFRATLTNPTPPGQIETQGTFGPWVASQPAETPLDGRYEFRNADLGVFDGIRGTLHSSGRLTGVLQRIEVDGTATVPQFALADVGTAVPLETRFHSIVDGTNGNTWLKPVDASLVRTPIQAVGGVIEREGQSGRTVTLNVELNDGRIEDILRLAVKTAPPPMTGALQMKTTFMLPPGKGDAIDKLRLDGSFQIAAAKFATGDLQAQLASFSRKATGDSRSSSNDVASNFSGAFVMSDGVIRFSKVTFTMPGTRVDLAGSYGLRAETLDFRGTVRLDARLSELTTGVKSVLLKPADLLLRRGNVTVVPITIGGTAEQPKFGVDVRRTLLRR